MLEQDEGAPLTALELGWIRCFCVCRFDEDEGPVIDYVVPRGSEVPERLIALQAFPDSNSAGPKERQGSSEQCFAFYVGSRMTESSLSPPYVGASFFRLDLDATTRRGGVQRAVCVVSEFAMQPAFALFLKDLIALLGPMFFEYDTGEAILESACFSISKWPYTKQLTVLELPIMGHVLSGICPRAFEGDEYQTRISTRGETIEPEWGSIDSTHVSPRIPSSHAPSPNTVHLGIATPASRVLGPVRSTTQDLKEIIDTQQCTHLKVPTGPVYLALNDHAESLWAIWEQVLVGGPLIVFGGRGSDFAQKIDEVVVLLTSLIAPIPYSADYRPSLTVYDPDYSKRDGTLPMLAGTTNPFVCQTLLDRQKADASTMALCYGNVQTLNFTKNDMKLENKNGGLYYRGPAFTVPPSQNLLRTLLTPKNREKDNPQVLLNNTLLRRHFYDLTISFIKPFLPYLTSSTVKSSQSLASSPSPDSSGPQSDGGLSTPDSPSRTRQFVATQFMPNLQPVGVFATLPRDKVTKLYARFLKGPNFVPWFNSERRAVVRCRKLLSRANRQSGAVSSPAASTGPVDTRLTTATTETSTEDIPERSGNIAVPATAIETPTSGDADPRSSIEGSPTSGFTAAPLIVQHTPPPGEPPNDFD